MIIFIPLDVSVLTLLPMTFATLVPVPDPDPLSESTASNDWTPVDLDSKIIYVNSAAIVGSSANPASKDMAARRLATRASPSSNTCDASSIKAHPAPFANTADRKVIGDWAGTQNSWWTIWDDTVDTHGILWYGTCVFEAGTGNIHNTWIGSSDPSPSKVRWGIKHS